MRKTRKRTINYRKFIKVLSITIILMVVMIFTVKSNASGLTKDSFQEVTVCKGDTLWTIAKHYSDGQDLQKVIYEIKKFNKLKKSDIFPGQKLIIPSDF